MSPPGPKPQPQRRLKDAAVDYSAALEAGDDLQAPWDKLRKAAMACQEGERPRGRPMVEAQRAGGEGA